MTEHGRLIDADALEKDGWMMHRTVQVDKATMSYQTKKPTDFPTIEPEPCEDAVSREAMRDEIDELIKIHFDRSIVLTKAKQALFNLPSVTTKRKTGKWEIYVISPFDGEGCRCSECKYEGVPYWDFCPNCGADMRGGQNE